jgi:hypothetical protein
MPPWRRGVQGLVLACAVASTVLAASAAAGAPVKLAVFTFELDDFSPAISSGEENPADTARLASVTEDVRKLLAESGRFELVDVDGAAVPAAKTAALRDCNGCEAPLALKLGAEQSLVGVVKRISRTEYQVRFQLRDAHTGTIIAEADSGLRMGALDSWNRGALRLIKDRLLKNPG